MVFYTSCIYAFKLVFKSLSSLLSLFGVITGLELHWMGDGPAGTKEAENNAIWWFSRRTVLMTVPDSGAIRVTIPTACGFDISYFLFLFIILRCFGEKKPDLRDGDLRFCYFVKGEGHLSRFREEPPEPYYFISVIFHSLGIKIDQHREQYHDSGLCMTSRHTRRNAQGELVTFTNQELARLERTNRQQPRKTDTTMDELTAKVDQLLKNNQGHVFNMEQPTAGHIQNQNQRQPHSNLHAVPAIGNSQPDELKGLGMMMQQLLQGQQVQDKALNQVTTEMDTRMGNMFTELNNKYDNLAIHIRKIDVQLAQTAESVKRQQETLPGRTDKNFRTEHCNVIEQPFAETVLGAEEDTEQSASSGVTGPSVPAETPPVRVYVPKVPYPIPPRHLMDPISEEQLIGFNKMVRRLPKELAFEDALQIRPLLQFFKHCRETQEEIKVLYTKALSTPALKVLPKVDDPGKFVFPCSIAGTTFKDALCDSGSCVNLVSKAIIDDLGIADVEQKLKVVPEKEHGDKGLELHWMGDGPAGTKEAENNAIWWFSRRTVLMTVPDSGATRVTVPTACGFDISYFLFLFIILRCFGEKKPDLRVGDLRFCYFVKGEGHLSRFREEPPEPYYFISVIFHVFCEHIGLDLYCLLSHLDPNESLGIKIDQHREQYHDSGLFYLSDPSSRLALN
ncbi:hypothetical protein IGI04_019489 [Brassica rapa subsp. trilocularis]|uniref:Aspartic peptidase DDI1-type domain-containing protein n=1 Tax=Brassica rapa subsp. trilocularis TaxID=1813537 RepID=A0ABQ7MID1_BRACM|nr:hypothetical protein IGI04_019489 [Brassica rapa subsp. trilocularis]